VLRGYLHDHLSAKHFALGPTGNGRRESFRATPLPRMTNTLLLNGPHATRGDRALGEARVYATRFGGGQVDIASGDFVFSLSEAYLIEDGKLTAPLKDVNLIGNGPDALGKVTMLGNDLPSATASGPAARTARACPWASAAPPSRSRR
jgi:TldD protein